MPLAASSFICSVDVAPVRAEPDDASEQVTQLLHDEPVEVEETRDGWCHVRTAYDYPGWVREDALVDGTGTLAGASPYVDPIDAAR